MQPDGWHVPAPREAQEERLRLRYALRGEQQIVYLRSHDNKSSISDLMTTNHLSQVSLQQIVYLRSHNTKSSISGLMTTNHLSQVA